MQQRQLASGLLKECAHKLREEKKITTNDLRRATS